MVRDRVARVEGAEGVVTGIRVTNRRANKNWPNLRVLAEFPVDEDLAARSSSQAEEYEGTELRRIASDRSKLTNGISRELLPR